VSEAPTVSVASEDDLDGLTTLFEAYLAFYGRPAERAAVREFLGARMSRGESVVLVARMRDELAGFAQLYPTFSSLRLASAWIFNDLFVAPGFREGGVGRALCEYAIDHARRSGASTVSLQTAHSNHAAQSLYRRLGFAADEEFQSWSLAVGI